MRNDRAVSLVALTVAALLVACSSARQTSEAQASSCTSCHGGPANSSVASPFFDPAGSTTSDTAKVHTAHLANNVACDVCHVVPAQVSDDGHLDVPANVTFRAGTLAWNGGASPSYDATTRTCSNVYCHAPANGGGQHVALTWAPLDLQCTGCHAAPPPPGHPVYSKCEICHEGYTAKGVNAATHLNGHADVGSPSCTACHGDASRATNQAAPPVDTQGRTLATDRGVGSHQTHLFGKLITDGVGCADCHTVPTTVDHVNGTVEVALKVPGTATPSGTFDATTGTCSNTYCHGNLPHNPRAGNSPVWNAIWGQGTCSKCHAAQMGSDFTDAHQVHNAAKYACAACHPASGNLPSSGTHVNGTIDILSTLQYTAGRTCTTACHTAGGEGAWY